MTEENPAEIVSWLRTPAGEEYSRKRLSGSVLPCHSSGDGAFAKLLPQQERFTGYAARWPEPFGWHELLA